MSSASRGPTPVERRTERAFLLSNTVQQEHVDQNLTEMRPQKERKKTKPRKYIDR